MSTWYKEGVVNVTQTSAVVTGVGTLFTLNVNAGDIFTRAGNKIYEVLSVNTNTQLTLTAVYAEATAASVAYAIVGRPGDPLEADVLTDIQTLVSLWTQRETDFTNWLTGTGSVTVTTLGGGTVSLKTPTQLNTDMAATAKTAAGAMVTGNTETGITVTYQSSDQTVDYAVIYAGTGAANSAARSDHTHTTYAATSHTHAAFTTTVAGFVPAPTAATGRFLKDDSTWGTVSFAGATFNDLTDVTISGALAGNVAYYNGTGWVNASLATAGIAAAAHVHSAADITSGTLAAARLPLGTTGSTAAYGNHLHNLDALTDVAVTAVASGNVLYYNGTTWLNAAPATAGLAATSHTHDASTAFVTGTVPIARLPTGTTGSTLAVGSHTHISTDITDFTEAAQDAAGAMVTGNTETGLTVSYDDPTGKLNFAINFAGSGVATTVPRSDHTHTTLTSTAITDFTETVQDIAGVMFVSGNAGLLGAYNDATGSYSYTLQYGGSAGTFGTALTVARSDHSHALDGEGIQDLVGAMVAGNTETGIAVTYDDTLGKLNYAVTYVGSGVANSAARSDHNHTVTYAALTAANTFTGVQTISAVAPRINWIQNDAITGLLVTDYSARVSTAGVFQIYKGVANTTGLRFDGATLTATTLSATTVTATTLTQTSDARLKSAIETIPNGLEIIERLRGVSYRWSATNKPAFGLIAQEVRLATPHVVHQDENTGYLSVDYQSLVGVLVEAVKELSERVRALEAR